MLKFLKSIFFLSYINSIRYALIERFRTYNFERAAKKLAYQLTHPDYFDFKARQRKLLYEIMKYAKENVPYYRNQMKNMQLTKDSVFRNLTELPLLSKAIIREQGKNIYSEQFEKDFGYWQKTGGSTGEPLEFPVSENFENLHAKCLYNIMGATTSDIIVAIDGTRIENSLLEKKIFWEEGVNFPYGSIHYSTLHMHDENMLYYIDHLNSVKPQIIRGYPSGLQNMANYLIRHNLKLKFNLKAIYLTSEFFDSSVSDVVRKAFGCPVFGQYGHSEVAVYAFTMADSLEYICSPLYGFTEVLDSEGKHVKVGETGEIVVTGFSNKVMPFIRYQTGDMAVYGGTQNGVVRLKSLQGRSADFIVNNDNEKIYLVGLIFGGHLKSFSQIKRWQIEQNIPGFVTVRIVKDVGFSEESENEIVKMFDAVDIKVSIEFVTNIPLSNRGKRKFLIQNIR